MKTYALGLLSLIGLGLGWARPALAQTPNWQLVWSDEFNGPAIDRSNWTYDLGGSGWGNRELECYTDRPENSRIVQDASGNGFLVIEARKESYQQMNYTSARLKTQGLQTWTYGRVEARINIPGGTGVWPAFWMLGAHFPDVGWPGCGELDIMEHVMSIGPNTNRGSAHGPNYSGADSAHGDITVQGLLGNFHIFALEWEPTQVRWYLDGKQYFAVTPQTVHGTWVFNKPFFLILNLAIGGDWPGSPDATTKLPVRMMVDYVRVYRNANAPAPTRAKP
jgi:beta-glucanase (GH16 family)